VLVRVCVCGGGGGAEERVGGRRTRLTASTPGRDPFSGPVLGAFITSTAAQGGCRSDRAASQDTGAGCAFSARARAEPLS
jgi:hypothetical protein